MSWNCVFKSLSLLSFHKHCPHTRYWWKWPDTLLSLHLPRISFVSFVVDTTHFLNSCASCNQCGVHSFKGCFHFGWYEALRSLAQNALVAVAWVDASVSPVSTCVYRLRAGVAFHVNTFVECLLLLFLKADSIWDSISVSCVSMIETSEMGSMSSMMWLGISVLSWLPRRGRGRHRVRMPTLSRVLVKCLFGDGKLWGTPFWQLTRPFWWEFYFE